MTPHDAARHRPSHLAPPDEAFLARLRGPVTGTPLEPAGPGLLREGDTLWPCLDGIPYLRLGREELRDEAVAAIRRGDTGHALAVLLADRKDASTPPADPAALRTAVAGVSSGDATAAGMMDLLGYGGLGTYFLHRWCLPTLLSGQALLEAHAPRGGTLLEVGCGAGHFLRVWEAGSGHAIGSDLVFSHLWLARHFTAPRAWLVCFDAAGPFPLADLAADVCLTHDSFHYFPDKPHAFRELRRLARHERVLLGHTHNAEAHNYAPGAPLTVQEYAALLRPRLAYDDADLTRAALTGVPAEAVVPDTLRTASALAFVHGPAAEPSPPGWLTAPRAGRPLRVNPLLTAEGPAWPTAQFAREFVEDWPYLSGLAHPGPVVAAAAGAGGSGTDPLVDRLARQRVLLDLPDRWL
ncbi:class I SAM-dependent methyltransferase [Streptomyces lancefieldiae]|uniref:Methyltransferase domain-containing protein n=1 Tax=Streptomyces lancefieldiae TaxID=3075520 RepID=A0ABU3B0U1_9ACTN|nr:methyltransferase domain-containing protein [Streptomyces sp. DSM 40712]MDT0616069.1 methyltransferase domain-containing protein [Streptomyces sp. DSM 40712]